MSPDYIDNVTDNQTLMNPDYTDYVTNKPDTNESSLHRQCN